MEQNRMLGISSNHGQIAEKIADNIESKLRFEEENPNSESNTTDLYPYL